MATNCYFCGVILDTISLHTEEGTGVCWTCYEKAERLQESLIALLFASPEY